MRLGAFAGAEGVDHDRRGETAPVLVLMVLCAVSVLSAPMASRIDGVVVGWGQVSLPYVAAGTRLTNVTSGAYHNLALTQNGTVISWGANGYGQAMVPTSLTAAVAIAAGYSHSLALRPDGTVVAWGDDSSGQASVPRRLAGDGIIQQAKRRRRLVWEGCWPRLGVAPTAWR